MLPSNGINLRASYQGYNTVRRSYGTYGRSKIHHTRLWVRVVGNDIIMRDVISVSVIEQIERNKDARFGIHEQNPRDVPFTP